MLSVFGSHMAKYSSVSSSLLLSLEGTREGFSCLDHAYLRAGNVVSLLPTLHCTQAGKEVLRKIMSLFYVTDGHPQTCFIIQYWLDLADHQ